MDKMILDATIAKVRQRASEGDCPITAPYSVEHLETALLTLADAALAHPPAQASESGGEMRSQAAIGNDADAIRALRNLMAPFGGYIKKHAPALYADMEAALSAPQAAPGEGEQS